MVAALLFFLPSRPEGDYLISSDARGYPLLGFGVVVLLFGIVTVGHRTGDAPPGRPRPILRTDR